jgi:hypothetical protein
MIDDNKRAFLKDRIVDQMTLFLMRDFNLSLSEALEVIYNSTLHLFLQDDETGHYLESPSYVYEYLKKEYRTGSCSVA